MGKYSGILICSDFDETIALKRIVSEENIKAIKYFCDNGGAFTVISGRCFGFMKEYANNIGINAPFAGLNGSYIWDFETGEHLHSVELDRTLISPCLEYMKSHNKLSHLILFSDKLTIKIIKKDGRFSISSHNSKDEAVFTEYFDDVYITEDGYHSNSTIIEDFLSNKIYKFVIGIPALKGDENFVVSENKKLIELTQGKLATSRAWPYSIELQNKNATKGTATKFIKNYIKADVSIGIGNYENDLTMIEDADIGVAVADSCEALLKAADIIVKPCKEHSLEDLILNLDNILSKR